ncbi:MAG TPA: cation:proton antiporter subunit C [Nocardioidaceae bacterium]|nr:cation:proton antiporter subunit C [Nocardioidaceae bacterium]
MSYLPYVVAVWLLVVGLYGVVTSRNLVHLTQCLAVAQSSSYLLLLAIGFRTGGIAPVFSGVSTGRKAVDPIVQALTLTDVVVSVTISGLLLAISVQVFKRHHSLDPAAGREMQG